MPHATEALANYEARVQNGEFDAQWDDLVNGIDKIYTHGDDEGLPVGYECMRELWSASKGQLVVVSGVPSHGKSTVIDNVLVNLARHNGMKTSFFSPEHFPYHLHVRKIAETYTGVALRTKDRHGNVTLMPMSKLGPAMEFIKKHFHWIALPDPTLGEIMEVWTHHIADFGCEIVVLDPWNEVQMQLLDRETETSYINRCLTGLRRFARKMNVLCIVIVHPTKIPRNKDGSFPVPSLSDCAGSAAWRAKADVGIICHRKDIMTGDEIDVHVQKVKFRQNGRPGIATLRFLGHYASKLVEA